MLKAIKWVPFCFAVLLISQASSQTTVTNNGDGAAYIVPVYTATQSHIP